jgi:hypothetical protein
MGNVRSTRESMAQHTSPKLFPRPRGGLEMWLREAKYEILCALLATFPNPDLQSALE